MRLYLSSFRIGSRPDELLALLRGGRRAAVILNADDYKTPEDRAASLLRELEELRSIGLEPQEVDLRGFFGRPDALRGHLVTVDLLYVRGGNVFVLRQALHQSGADRIIGDLLARDEVVYGGYSAGTCVLGPTLRGIESAEDDPHLVPEGYQTEVIWEGLGLLPSAIAPHHEAPTPGGVAAAKLVRYCVENHIRVTALRDGEALVVDGDTWRVVSSSG